MRKLILMGFLVAIPGGFQGQDCSSQLAALKLPFKMKMGKKPLRARWAPVERALTDLRTALEGSPCELLFKDAFEARQSDFFFPLLENLLRTAPQESLVGAGVYSQDGSRLGDFSNRVPYERNGRVNYYFQFKDSRGQLQAGGNRGLIDVASGRPIFQLKWSEISERTLFEGGTGTEP